MAVKPGPAGPGLPVKTWGGDLKGGAAVVAAAGSKMVGKGMSMLGRREKSRPYTCLQAVFRLYSGHTQIIVRPICWGLKDFFISRLYLG